MLPTTSRRTKVPVSDSVTSMTKRSATAVFFFVVLVSTMVSSPAGAHAVYEGSNPPDNGTVSSPPSQVTADFSEPLIPEGSSMDVTDPCGADVGGDTFVTAQSMTVSMSGSARGTYVVSWRATSSVDGHTTEGQFSFASTGGDECPGQEEPTEEKPENEPGREAGTGTSTSGGGGSSAPETSGSAGEGTTSGRDRGDAGSGREPSRDRDADRGKDARASTETSQVAAPAIVEDQSPTVSALDGIPLGGLVITLAISALIGAAAAKVYVSLSGDI